MLLAIFQIFQWHLFLADPPDQLCIHQLEYICRKEIGSITSRCSGKPNPREWRKSRLQGDRFLEKEPFFYLSHLCWQAVFQIKSETDVIRVVFVSLLLIYIFLFRVFLPRFAMIPQGTLIAAVALRIYIISRISLPSSASQCSFRVSMDGKTLNGHTFASFPVKSPFECAVKCERESRCQSYNYVIAGRLCELNNRTKEANPGHLMNDPGRFYMKKWIDRGNLCMSAFCRFYPLKGKVLWVFWYLLLKMVK